MLLDLTASNPTACGFVYPERGILAALADPLALEYKPESKGLVETRAAVAEYYARPAKFCTRCRRREPGANRADVRNE